MKETPIFFKSEMVRAILQGRKTQTRRVVTVPWSGGRRVQPYSPYYHVEDGKLFFCDEYGDYHEENYYGVPGDRLWIRESMICIALIPGTGRPEKVRVEYCADGAKSDLIPYPERLKGKPRLGHHLSYGGYREASRITLKLVSVRVERLQDISEEDAKAEGCKGWKLGAYVDGQDVGPADWETPQEEFQKLWNSINAKRGYSWISNPWLWRLEFKRIVPTVAAPR